MIGRLIVGVLLYALFYLTGFSGAQSVLLIGIIGWLYFMIRAIRQAPEPPFSPYQLTFLLHVETILADLEILPRQWPPELQASIDSLPQEPSNVWNSRLLQVSAVNRDLYFNHGWNTFSSDIHLHANLEPLAITQDGVVVIRPPATRHDRWSHPPMLNLSRQGLSVSLLTSYWDKIKDKELLKDLHASPNPRTGTVDVTLAIVPEEEYAMVDYNRATAEPQHRAEMVRLRADARRRHGWSGEVQSENDFEAAVSDEESAVAKHRYMTVIRTEL